MTDFVLGADCEFSRVYKIVASTPLIHFQYNESGATLRATEMKPKLDRFLLKKAKAANIDYSSWCLGEREAFDYKLRISACASSRIVELGAKTEYDIFYGNMGGNLKKGVICDAEVSFLCFIPELMALIDKHLAEFFAVSNFGTMQSKGFGSFFLAEKHLSDKDVATMLKQEYGAKRCYRFTVPKGGKVFGAINKFYKRLKSGESGWEIDGFDSLLFEYCFNDMGIVDEKSWLARSGVAPTGHYEKDDRESDYAYLRPLLGLCANVRYRNKDVILVEDVTGVKEPVERLSSPVFFKVREAGAQFEVYVVAKRINPEIYGRTFRFTNKSTKKSTELTVPDIDELGEDFIDRFMEHACRVAAEGGNKLGVRLMEY